MGEAGNKKNPKKGQLGVMRHKGRITAQSDLIMLSPRPSFPTSPGSSSITLQTK